MAAGSCTGRQKFCTRLCQPAGEEHDTRSVARALAIEPLRFTRGFKAATGLTLPQYRLRARLERARRLLLDGVLPIKVVALEAGFYDQAHLTRVFREAYGSTPSRFRRAHGRRARTHDA